MAVYNIETNYQGPTDVDTVIAMGTALDRVDLECLNCSAIDNLRSAAVCNLAANDPDAPYGFVGHKIQASISFAQAAFAAIIPTITNLFLVIISAPFALVSDTAADFCYIHAHHFLFSALAPSIGLVGTVSPNTGEEMFRFFIRDFIDTNTRCNILRQLDEQINESVDGLSGELLTSMGLPPQEGCCY
jgi:hypothetical protein